VKLGFSEIVLTALVIVFLFVVLVQAVRKDGF